MLQNYKTIATEHNKYTPATKTDIEEPKSHFCWCGWLILDCWPSWVLGKSLQWTCEVAVDYHHGHLFNICCAAASFTPTPHRSAVLLQTHTLMLVLGKWLGYRMMHAALMRKEREMIMMLRSCCRDAVLRISKVSLQRDLSIMKAKEEAMRHWG